MEILIVLFLVILLYRYVFRRVASDNVRWDAYRIARCYNTACRVVDNQVQNVEEMERFDHCKRVVRLAACYHFGATSIYNTPHFSEDVLHRVLSHVDFLSDIQVAYHLVIMTLKPKSRDFDAVFNIVEDTVSSGDSLNPEDFGMIRYGDYYF